MSAFSQLDSAVSRQLDNFPGSSSQPLVDRLRHLAPLVEFDGGAGGSSSPDDLAMVVDENVGDKRKLYVLRSSWKPMSLNYSRSPRNGSFEGRPRKRTRLSPPYPIPLLAEKDHLSELWWGAVQSDDLLANGLPGIPFTSSSSAAAAAASSSTQFANSHPRNHKPNVKRKRKKKGTEEQPKTLLNLMNNNIKTMRRMRHTHRKFAALNLNSSNNEEGEAGGEGAGFAAFGAAPAISFGDEDGVEAADDQVDDRPWTVKGKGKARGIEIGERNANDCVRWMGSKVLEHVGFQGGYISLAVAEVYVSRRLILRVFSGGT